MKILFRNFTGLLSVGVFKTDNTIEPMSVFKWAKLMLMARVHDVEYYICLGIAGAVETGCDTIPQKTYSAAKAFVDVNNIYAPEAAGGYNFSSSRKVKMFSSVFLNRKYNKIIFNEIHSIDTSISSLVFLNKLAVCISTIMDYGIDFKILADLGLYLRQSGDKIDYVKTESWIKALNIRNITELIGECLIILFHFESAELPFIKNITNKYSKKVCRDLVATLNDTSSARKRNKIKKSNAINPINKPDTHPAKYLTIQPVEASSRLIANTVKSLSNIDE